MFWRRKKLIYIIDDDSTILKSYTNFVNRHYDKKRHNFRYFDDADEALSSLVVSKEIPNAILLDLSLGAESMSGQAFLAKMSKIRRLNRVPVLVLTNIASENERDFVINELKADEYIVKVHTKISVVFSKLDEYL